MAKTKISEYDSTSANNTDVDSINIAEGCAPSGINNAIREVMAHLKDFQTGASGDSLTVGGNLSVTGTVTIPDNAISGDKVEGGTIDAITINTLSANPTLSAGTANGVTYLNGSKVLTSGSALTFNGSTLATTGALTVGGNTTLGDASTDTVTVNGYMGVGVAPSSAQGIKIGSTGLTSAFQYGIFSNVSGNSSATTFIAGVATSPTTEASAFTAPDVAGFRASTPTKGAGSTITNLHGLYIADQTQGTNNYGITSLVSSGTNKWNIYASGTAANYFAGSVGVGTTTFRTLNSDTPIFQIVGSGSSSSSAGLTRNSNDAGAPILYFGKTRGTTPGGTTAVSANDDAALLRFTASDGTDLIRTAQINVSVDGSVSTGVVPGRFVFSLANTSGALTERFKLSSSEAVFNDPGNDYDFRIESDTNSHAFFLEGSSGNVGIGTSSPTRPLHINATGTNGTQLLIQSGSASGIQLKSNAGKEYEIQSNASSNLIFYDRTSAATRLTLDSAGNLGLGVTPSGWGSGFSAIDLGSNSRISGSASISIANNAFFNGTNWIYKNTATAGSYSISNSGVHSWSTAPSGTAGSAISFTQAMTLDASGNLFVNGTTQIAGAKLNVRGNNVYIGVGGDTVQMLFGDNTTDGFLGTFTNHALTIRTNNTERLRIDSSGNVGIGTSSPLQKLDVSGNAMRMLNGSFTAYLGSQLTLNGSGGASDFTVRSDNALTFSSGGPYERARIDSSGNLLVGSTSVVGAAKFGVAFNGGAYNAVGLNDTTSTIGCGYIYMQVGGTTIGSIVRVGSGSTVAYNTSSDYRLKEDWQPMAGASERVKALKPVNFAWKADGSRVDGFLAHEAQAVVPECVTGEKDAVDAEGKPVYQGIDQSKLVPLLTAALQEALAKIESLEARLDAANL